MCGIQNMTALWKMRQSNCQNKTHSTLLLISYTATYVAMAYVFIGHPKIYQVCTYLTKNLEGS